MGPVGAVNGLMRIEECGRPSDVLRATNRKIMFMLMLHWHMVGYIYSAKLYPLIIIIHVHSYI